MDFDERQLTDPSVMQELKRGHDLAKLMCRHCPKIVPFVLLGQIGLNGSIVALGNWAGDRPKDLPLEGFAIYSKAFIDVAQLLWFNKQEGLTLCPVSLPVKGKLDPCILKMGGAKFNFDAVSVKGWAPEHNLLMGLVILYSLEHKIQLHHINIRFETCKKVEAASDEFKRKNNSGGTIYYFPHTDFKRTLYPMRDDIFFSDKGYFVEFQLALSNRLEIYWDFITPDPLDFLKFVSSPYQENPVVSLRKSDSDPFGAFLTVSEQDKIIMGVSARSEWWEPIK